MITEEKLELMHDSAISQNEITTKELKEMGFNSNDLTKMVKEGELDRIRTGFYVVPVSKLHVYGKSLLKSKESDKAYKCFKTCYELEPDNINVLLQLFYQSLVKEDYPEVFKYFNGIFNTNDSNENNIADNYLYLYLLSYITDIPSQYKTILDSMDVKDIELTKKTPLYKNLEEINELRRDILEHKFKYVSSKLQKMIQDRKFSSIRETILKELLFKANKEKAQDFNLISSYIEKKDYESLVLTLEAERDVKGLSFLYENLLLVARDYLEISHTERIPDIPNFTINNTFNAISRRHYKRALELLIQHCEAKAISLEKNMLYCVLVDINELIDSLSYTVEEDKQLVLKGFDGANKEESNDLDDNFEPEQLVIAEFEEEDVTYADVVVALIGKKKEEAEDILTKYFNQKGIIKYRFIIDSLLDICILENDLSYSKAMIELANMGSPKYKLDLSSYIQGFYLSLSGTDYDIAQKYLDIIEYANDMVPNKIDVNILKKSLDNLTNTKVEMNSSKQIIEESSTDKVEHDVEEKTTKPKVVKKEAKDVRPMFIDADEELVHNKISVFENGEDIVVLKAMDNERRKNIHRIVASIPSVKSFSIGNGLSRRIVLTNSPYIECKINKRALSIEGDKAYREQDYEKCIECYRTLLYLVKPSANVYAKLGLAYMKKNQLEKAIKYLTISTELSKEVDGTFDFTELIDKLSGKGFDAEETKPKFHMDESEFLSEENYYGVEHIEDISRMVFGENISLEEACKTFNYDENQMNVIRLIYAEEYYRAGDYKSGDALVKVVTNAKDKSKRVKKILEQVNARKKFYKNSPRENSLVYMYK